MKKILLLEDQGLVRAGMRALILQAEPEAEVTEVASYESAIEQLEHSLFDFAFLDIDLKSEKNGRDVLAHITLKELGIPVVMLSAYTQRELILDCLQYGAIGFVSKDINEDQIFRKILGTFFEGGIFIPLERDGNLIQLINQPKFVPAVTPESLGIRGRTLEVLTYVCQGLTNKAIANRMKVEEGTIRKDYVPKLFRILKVTRRTELLIEVSRLGLRLPKVFKD